MVSVGDDVDCQPIAHLDRRNEEREWLIEARPIAARIIVIFQHYRCHTGIPLHSPEALPRTQNDASVQSQPVPIPNVIVSKPASKQQGCALSSLLF